MRRINLLIVRFKNDLHFAEVDKFRGAVNALLKDANILFHNHSADGYRYAYPLIQYKSLYGRAAIVCLEEGTEHIGDFFANLRQPVRVGEREMMLELDGVRAEQCLIQLWDSMFDYTLRNWLPFNSENYAKYQQIEGLKERLSFMEHILTGNILSMAKGLGIRFENELRCSIIDFKERPPLRYKEVKLTAFDLKFRSNVSLPDYVGIGKGASHGAGEVRKLRITN